ncbi:hypothetical protein Salat_2160000 [Sesamum alatum]|uniref:Retrotransposon gag domain-containing protein n=1 Tax=Sesamum alatum TaxID=300844 RepID=A0AAE2CHA5_9LAMI|nr:hypothetical protein Salat_2160000 [Sesamum alatum]
MLTPSTTKVTPPSTKPGKSSTYFCSVSTLKRKVSACGNSTSGRACRACRTDAVRTAAEVLGTWLDVRAQTACSVWPAECYAHAGRICVRKLGGQAGARAWGNVRCARAPGCCWQQLCPTDTRSSCGGFQSPGAEPVTLFPQTDALRIKVNSLQRTVDELPSFVEGRIVFVIEEVSALTDSCDQRFEALRQEVNVLKCAIGRDKDRAPQSKVKVPDLKPFGGARSAKELENFPWDMEAYFQATRIPEEEKVSTTSMYLTGDVKLWWRTRLSDDASANRDRIETWDVLRKELKDQFLPCNTSWLVRELLQKLKHSGTIRDYMKEFSSLMLDIKEMAEKDKLFNFPSGPQTWA